jgi:signal transduction histidine kinase
VQIEESDVPEDLKIVIFRIVHEALNNVAKHARAEWMDLWLVISEGWMELAIEDNGFPWTLKCSHMAAIHRVLALQA